MDKDKDSNMNDDVGTKKAINSKDDDDDDNLNNELSNINIKSGSSRHCLYCLKAVESSLRCSKCRTALYCGRACQEKHWPVHKNICINSNREDSNEKLEMKAENQLNQGNCIHNIQRLSLIIYIITNR